MSDKILLSIPGPISDLDICRKLATALVGYKDEPEGEKLFVVEGTADNPIVAIRYPGKKAHRRVFKRFRPGLAEWANLFDFAVVPFKDGAELDLKGFTFEHILRDYVTHKIANERLWELLTELHQNNVLSSEPPALGGIESRLFLLTIKWIWIQEDLNYRFKSDALNSSVKYTLENDKGARVSGVGRKKFYAGFVLLRAGFTLEEVFKIIPPYG